jgi:two-component system alkaline phosphatase synthesis response regulator PhoP
VLEKISACPVFLKNMDKKKVLIVEDDLTLQKTLMEFLKMENFEVIAASDGEEGLEQAKKFNPELILLDIILPKKDGYEVVKELKDSQQTENIPIILLTNLESLNDVEKALKLGVKNYLVKSDYKMDEIAKKIREILKVE